MGGGIGGGAGGRAGNGSVFAEPAAGPPPFAAAFSGDSGLGLYDATPVVAADGRAGLGSGGGLAVAGTTGAAGAGAGFLSSFGANAFAAPFAPASARVVPAPAPAQFVPPPPAPGVASDNPSIDTRFAAFLPNNL